MGLERVAGIEPAYSAWKAAALPLCYTRKPAEKLGFSGEAQDCYAIPFCTGGDTRDFGAGQQLAQPAPSSGTDRGRCRGSYDEIVKLQRPFPADRLTVRGPVFPTRRAER